MIVASIIIFFSIIQSLFGMGLLVFGTPTLILLGHSYLECLAYLLPPSITISTFQVIKNNSLDKKTYLKIFTYCLPMIFIGLFFQTKLEIKLNLELFIAIVLFISVLSNAIPKLKLKLKKTISTNSNVFLMIMGVVHGLTNMGGGLLSVFSNSQYKNKEQIRQCVSFCYLWFGIVQILVILSLRPELIGKMNPGMCLAASLIYLTLGRYLFALTSRDTYKQLFNFFMAIYACLLSSRATGLWH
jgi:uncharacterized membrane protein YfcA